MQGTRRIALLWGTLLIGTSVALFSATDVQSAPKPGTWTTLTPVPHVGLLGVEGPSGAVIGNKIYLALGLDGGDTSAMRIYDIATDTWSMGASAPGTSSEGAGVAHGGLFYNVGGRLGGPRADIWSYDPVTDSWDATLTPMSTGRTGLALAVVGNSIYAIGGRSNTGGPCSGAPLASVERYDIATDTWTAVAALPSARSDLAAATIGGKIYVFGGCDASGAILADVDVYDPATDSWSTAPTDMPTARAGMYSVASKGGTVYVIGGWDGVVPGLTTVEAYKVSKDAWSTGLPAMPTGRAEHAAVGHGGRIYVLGGAKPGFGQSVDANEVFKP